MKCKTCKTKDREGKNDICSSCRLKKWRKENAAKVKTYAKMRYRRDREKILAYAKAWHKNNNYAYFKSGEAKKNNAVRRKTRHKYPLEGNACQFCDSPAEHRHHTTHPIETDKFMFICKDHHDEIHGRQCVIRGKDE